MRIYCLLFLFLATSLAISQEDAWVYFKDKPDSQIYLDSPLKMLSQRALDRRTLQNISLDAKDVPIPLSYVNEIKATNGITVKAKSKWLNALHIRGTISDINQLKALPIVEKVVFANQNLSTTAKVNTVSRLQIKSKKLETQTNFAYGNSVNQIQMLNGQYLHQQNFTGSGKIIAIIDGGFLGVDTAQPFKRLRDNNKILGGYDFVGRDANFYTKANHGTMVLSSIGGYKENELIGTAPDASYYLFITEDDASENPIEESLWVEAAERADSLGVDIINTSLGYFDYDNPNYSHTYKDMTGDKCIISKGANIAFFKGMIVVASAGNNGQTAEPHIGTPAEATEVIAVGAVTPSRYLASFSSIGPSYDGRLKPNVMAQGESAVLSDQYGNIVTANGTSFSAPIMTGMLACLWQAFPNKTNKEIRELVQSSSDRYEKSDDQFGYGIPNFNLLLMSNTIQLANNDFMVYPNPSADVICFNISDSSVYGNVLLYDSSGVKIKQKRISSKDPILSVIDLSAGIYFYELEIDGQKYKTGKIIKK